jgi:hypothetical protein
LLPPGTFKALKNRPNEIVVVVVFAMSASAIGFGAAPWPIVAMSIAALLVFHLRATQTERHNELMAQHKVNEAVAKAEAIKAQYRRNPPPGQPSLPLEITPQRLTRGRLRDKDAGQ